MVNFFENEYAQKTDKEENEDRGASLEDEKFMEIIAVRMKHDGVRFSMSLPLRRKDTTLPDSKPQVMSRLTWQLKRMKKDEKYHAEYTAFMNKLIEKGHAEPRETSLSWLPQELDGTYLTTGSCIP